MVYNLVLTGLGDGDAIATIECAYQNPGSRVAAGAKLFDISVDLSSSLRQDCPPISYYRLIARESAILLKALAAPGDRAALGDTLALFGQDASEPQDGPVSRALRITIAGILWHGAMWSANNPS
jgi:hypothetical protein